MLRLPREPKVKADEPEGAERDAGKKPRLAVHSIRSDGHRQTPAHRERQLGQVAVVING